MTVLDHPDKANVVSNDLSQLSMVSLSHIHGVKKNLVKDVHRFVILVVRLEDSPNGSLMVHHNAKSSLVFEVKFKQHFYQSLIELKESILGKLNESFRLGGCCLEVSTYILCSQYR